MEEKRKSNNKKPEIIEKIKSIIKRFKSLNNFNKLLWICIVLAWLFYLILIPYFIFIFISFSAQTTYTKLLEPLGLDFQGPIQTFYLWALLLGTILLVNFTIKKRINVYLWASIFLSVFLIIFGLSFIGETYSSDLPASIYWKPYSGINYLNEENCSYTRLDCMSVKDKINFVEGDEVYCTFEINESCSFWISDFNVNKNYLNSKNFTPLEADISKNLAVFRFEVEKSLQSLWVHPYISNGSYLDSPFWALLELDDVYSDEEYLSLKQSKSLAIITLISISLFSTFVAMNNLKQLIERKNERRKRNNNRY